MPKDKDEVEAVDPGVDVEVEVVHSDAPSDEGAEFGPDVDTHQVQRLAESAQKAAETAAAAEQDSADDQESEGH